MNVQREERMSQDNKENAQIISRQFALDQEKLRSREIVKSAPPPSSIKSDSLNKTDDSSKVKIVSYHDAQALMTTRYHMPDSVVDKANPSDSKQDARKEAKDEEIRSKLIEQDNTRMSQERMEKARLRGKHALEKEVLNQNYNEILHELNDLQKADRERRQKELMNIPKDIFLPAWQRKQHAEAYQNEMEREFEKILGGNNQEEMMPQPTQIEEISENNLEDADLDLTLIDLDMAPEKPAVKLVQSTETAKDCLDSNVNNKNNEDENNLEKTNSVISSSNTTKASVENTGLSKILEKIRKQREEMKEKSAKINEEISITDDDSCLVDSSNNSSIIISETNNKINLPERDVIPIDIEPISENSSTTTKSTMTKKSENNADNNQAQKQIENEKKKIMRGIMMSSHNVSSLHEFQMLDSNRLLLNAKMAANVIASEDETNEDQDKLTTVTNAQTNIINNNSVVYSIDLSHASRDPMIAGSKELFNKNDIKLTIELKQKQLQKKQQELEKKLKELEEQEAILEKESSSSNNTSTSQQKDQQPLIMLNQPQLNNNNNQKPTTSQSTTAGPDSGNDHNYNSDDTSAITNTLTENQHQQQQLSADDLKRIQYQQSLLNKITTKPPITTSTISTKSNEIMIDNCSMNTSSSGFGSCLTADSAAKLIEQRKKEILKTFGIESNEDIQLNQFTYNPFTISSVDSGIVSTQSSVPIGQNYYNMNLRNQQTIESNSLTITDESLSTQKQSFKQQQQFDLVSYLNGQIDQDEYKRRLSSNLNILNNSAKGKDLNQLFGLELFDESDNLRDRSIEKLIGIGLKNINSMTNSQIKSNLIHSPSSSSNDTLNDQDEDSSFNNLNRNNNNNNNNNNINNSTDKDESEDEDISRDLLISLLNNRQSKISPNHNSQQLIEMKKQFIQSQLDSVRRQKEQLNIKNNRLLNSGLPPQPPPQSKMHQRLVNELNSHELSTIKEVDTPKSERNFKLTSNNKYKSKNDSSVDLSTSLESVTQISNEKSSSSSSGDSTTTTSMVSFNNANNKSSSSSTPISTQTPYHNPQLLDINLIRQKQKELFNMSLFESSSSDNSSLISPNNTKNKNLVQYGAKIYDSLSSTNLSISAMNNNSNNSNLTLNNSVKQKVAFKTESTSSTDQSLTHNNSSCIMNISNNNKSVSGKTWFDILASEDDTVMNKTNDKQNETILSQHPLSDTSSEEELENTYNNNNNDVTNRELEKTLQPVKYSPPTKQNNSNSLSMQSLSSASSSSMMSSNSGSDRGSGMFDKFLKNYTSQTCAVSVMDEPEISFVSTVNSSTTNSPQKKNGGGINILVKNSSNTTFASSSYTSCNETASTSFSNNSNLIQFQQKQLSKKFANMSPIETNSLNNQNNPKFSMTNSTISNFTLLEQTSKLNEDEDDNRSTKSSLILLSPNKIYNEKSTSLVHGLINDDDEEISQSFIEGALKAPFEFNKFKKFRDENDDYLSDSLVSFEQHEISQLTQTTIDQQNLNRNNSSRCSSANSTNEETTIENNNFYLSNITAEYTQNISKIFDKFKEKINPESNSNNDTDKDKKKFLKYSTPKLAITKSYQSSITNVTNYDLEGDDEEVEADSEINSLSKNLAKNLDTSAISSNNSSFVSQCSSNIFKKPKVS